MRASRSTTAGMGKCVSAAVSSELKLTVKGSPHQRETRLQRNSFRFSWQQLSRQPTAGHSLHVYSHEHTGAHKAKQATACAQSCTKLCSRSCIAHMHTQPKDAVLDRCQVIAQCSQNRGRFTQSELKKKKECRLVSVGLSMGFNICTSRHMGDLGEITINAK